MKFLKCEIKKKITLQMASIIYHAVNNFWVMKYGNLRRIEEGGKSSVLF
jgi:hypothetical protein